ncbi:MAG: hypothetical protein JJE48_10105 [Actinobacteria bacterium]|nr:hypothetical protein [Actinomycetota bacterium]
MPKPWLAWIPVLNVWLLCKVVGHGIVWTILCFVPLVDIVMTVLIALKLARACGRRRAYGLLLLIPLVNYMALWVLAFGHRPSREPGLSTP